MEAGESYIEQMSIYPVINLTLKSVKQRSMEAAYIKMKEELAEEFKRHQYILDNSGIEADDEKKFREIAGGRAGYDEYSSSLKFLCRCLYQVTGKNTIILIDEYDVPLENAYFKGFYDEMVDFIRSLFESALKTTGW